MSNNLIQNLNCSDVYRAYTLLLTADKDSLETNTTLKQLAGFVGEELDNYKKSKSTLSFNDKLRATGEVVIRDIDSKRKDRHWTMYRFNQVEPGNYRRIGREFYDTYNTLDLKLRGFILKLFSVTEPHSYVRFFVKFGGNLFFISTVSLFFFLNPIKSCRYVCFLVTLKTPHH